MNIFKALSQGDGIINETNVTSFLSYIFNETNEFSSSFLLLFLEQIEKQLNDYDLQNIINISGKNYRQRINDFKSKYTYSAIPEYRLQKDVKIQDVDILLTISEKISENDCCYILIENKIKRSALKEQQCAEQYMLFNEIEDFQENVPVFSILITPDIDIFKTMIERVIEENVRSVWLKWETDKDISIVDLFRHLIKLEGNSEISPIDNNTQYIIKSFIDYISTELSIKERANNFSVAGSKIVEQAVFEINGDIYSLKRFDNKMIRLFDANDEMTDESVKPILRNIITQYKLDVNLERSPGKRKNTQTLGRDVIRAMNNRI
ncbi:MAG: hypothetical protein K8R86_10005 [Bacteroidales bacterium]|nr:hypothetical protein [Bacteroidales bacterium]